MLTVVIAEHDIDYWWICGVPWIILCWPGILMTIPFVLLYGFGMGTAQADATSDAFILFLMFVMPTGLTILTSELWHRCKHKFVAK